MILYPFGTSRPFWAIEYSDHDIGYTNNEWTVRWARMHCQSWDVARCREPERKVTEQDGGAVIVGINGDMRWITDGRKFPTMQVRHSQPQVT